MTMSDSFTGTTDWPEHVPPALRIDATPQEWADPRWQLRHSFRTAQQLERVLRLTDEEREALAAAGGRIAAVSYTHLRAHET